MHKAKTPAQFFFVHSLFLFSLPNSHISGYRLTTNKVMGALGALGYSSQESVGPFLLHYFVFVVLAKSSRV